MSGESRSSASSASLASGKPAHDWLDCLSQRTTPQFGQLATWILLATCLIFAFIPWEVHTGTRQGPSSLLSWMPASWLDRPELFWFFRALLIGGAVAWFFFIALPYSCWLTVIGFWGLWAMHVENVWHTSHIVHLAGNLLVIQALWYCLLGDEMLAARRAGTFWKTPLYPHWVSLSQIAAIGLFHTAAGISKLWFSGPAWASGVSLQLWAHMDGRDGSIGKAMILADSRATAILQAVTLVVETAGILAVFPRLRTWIGLGTIGFYMGVIATFDYGFHFNLLFTALYLLPVEAWVNKRYAPLAEPGKISA